MSKVPLDSACGCLPASATGLAAGEAVGEEGEEGDDALFCALAVCMLYAVVLVCSLSYVDDGLANGDDAVHDGHEAAGDGRDHGVELEHVS